MLKAVRSRWARYEHKDQRVEPICGAPPAAVDGAVGPCLREPDHDRDEHETQDPGGIFARWPATRETNQPPGVSP